MCLNPRSIKYEGILSGKRILLIIGGSIAAYKGLDLIRRLRERGAKVYVVLTLSAQAFITPLSVSVLTGGEVFKDLFSYMDGEDVSHIRLARKVDMVIIAPCTASRLAKIVSGLAEDLAGAVLLAIRVPLLLAPAMNPGMWNHPATQRNINQLRKDGVYFSGPEKGEMAESGEFGLGRMSDPLIIVSAVEAIFVRVRLFPHSLIGKRIIVTSGPTYESLDPVRYIANRSSGKQGHAIAAVLASLGGDVVLVSGPVALRDPWGVQTIHVEKAQEMYCTVQSALPADVLICVAAVVDWRADVISAQKIKKQPTASRMNLDLVENIDILSDLGKSVLRPRLVIGFSAETGDVLENAKTKRLKKKVDWMLANHVCAIGGERNRVYFIRDEGVEAWPEMEKFVVAERLVKKIVDFFEKLSY